MNQFWERVERINSKLIIPAVILLLVIIIFELFIHLENHTVHSIIEIIDYLVIAIFVIDLIFLGIKAKTTRFFFKNYWLDILAIFPFVFTLNTVGKFVRLFSTKGIGVGQAIFHESLEVSKVAGKAEKFTKVGKSLKIGTRSLRVITKSRLFSRFKRKKLKHTRI
jgi:hypothetical protein